MQNMHNPRPKGWDKPIPGSVRYMYRGRVCWGQHWSGLGLWTVEPDDDYARLVKCGGNWRDAIHEYETEH